MIGKISIFCGPITSGKSEELIRRVNRCKCMGKNALIFKCEKEERSHTFIVSRNSLSLQAYSLHEPEMALQIYDLMEIKPDIIAIDEIQIMPESIVSVVRHFASLGVDIYISGLDKAYGGKPFGYLSQLLAVADIVEKKQAVCFNCLDDTASFTYWVNEHQLEARCFKCFDQFVI
ncbi:MAG TPA: hypothetical protein VD757_00130 [Candidatus Nitrosocosmicus sp.]|nr:hypothetical protein [Candidatus Nitrosocosmicus sp.]